MALQKHRREPPVAFHTLKANGSSLAALDFDRWHDAEDRHGKPY